jgi:Domain of unknown function (DUF4160)
MPTVHRFRGFNVVIYPSDHTPAHVHVIGKGGMAVFKLHCPDGPPELRETAGLTRKEVTAIANELETVLRALCAKWGEVHHGQY